MRNFKRLAAMASAVALAACAVAPLGMNVFAAATVNKISFKDEVASTGHTYIAYRIFDGEVKATSDNNTTELTDIKWANKEKSDAFLTALKVDITIGEDFTNCSNAVEVAKVLEKYENDSDKAKEFAKLVVAQKDNLITVNTTASSTIEATQDGYYVIVESALSGTPEDSAMTSYLLAVYDASEGAEISVKSAIPTVIKKIKENSDINSSVGTMDDKMKDYAIPANYNDTADFSIGDTVPFQIVGSMPSNIAEYDSYKYIFHDTLGSQFTLADDFATSGVKVTINGTEITSGYFVTAQGNEITITFENIKNVATLTADSKVVVDYSATLNNTATIGQNGQTNEVYLEYSNNPNVDGDGTTSKTPTDTVIAFTYELDVTKIDGADNDVKLQGAKFKLQATDGEHNGKWVQVDNNGKVSGWTDSKDDASELTSETDGIFKVIGLDAGAYSLEETEAPTGYNKLETPISLTITANTSNSQNDNEINGEELSVLQIKVGEGDDATTNGTLDKGAVAMNVENNSGASLPGTGGIGTTIFYVGGGAMVAVAGVFLITKKRMGKKEE